MQIAEFQELVWDYYRQHGRHDLPWRQPQSDGSYDPYRIWVSEIMLQQTQVSRVLPKFNDFLVSFPDVVALAAREQGTVLAAWNGLGYNRRAKFLWQAATFVITECGGQIPNDLEALVRLPGVGRNTAAAILAYAYNEPVVFVETNIRTVFIHHFFEDADSVDDKELLPLIADALDRENPREWYWALMDYGTHLKREVGNAARASKHFTRQSAFEGSLRQIRGFVIRELTHGPASFEQLQRINTDMRLKDVLDDLIEEELIHRSGDTYRL